MSEPRITGGTPVERTLTDADLALVFEIYEKWRAAGVGEVTCSKKTFEDHLNFPQLYAGPWKWNITSMAYGDVKLYSHNGAFLGTCTVSSLVLH